MNNDLSKLSDEEFIQAYNARKSGGQQAPQGLQALMQPSQGAMSSPIAQALMMVAGKKPSDYQNTQDNDLSKFYNQEMIKKAFNPDKKKVVALGVDDNNQPIWGYPPEGYDVQGSTTIFGKNKPFDMDAFNQGEETEKDISNQQPQNIQPIVDSSTVNKNQEPALNEQSLLQMKQQALDEGRDPDDVESIFQEEMAKIKGSAETDLIGDVAEFDIDESDRQYLLQQDFDPEMIDNVLGKAQIRKKGALNANR